MDRDTDDAMSKLDGRVASLEFRMERASHFVELGLVALAIWLAWKVFFE